MSDLWSEAEERTLEEQLKGALDCGFCGRRCDEMFPPETGGFNSFQRLAQHVSYCPWAPIPRGAGKDLEFAAARILAANQVSEAKMRGDTNMALPAPKEGTGQPGAGQAQRLPFLKVEDCPKEKTPVLILAVDPNGSGYNDMILKIKMNGNSLFYGLKVNNPVYKKLYGALGANEEDWVGASFEVFPEWNEFYSKNFIGCGKITMPAGKKK